ncbi:MAG TPA: hypothetical protein VHL59_08260 [Thermoanaerobaculia bacterium]|nr:hypothetical protein [Thermoanaerobaculia bacterium]
MAAAKSRRKPAKEPPQGETVALRPSLKVLGELDRLTALGLFGKSRTEVAEELMRAQLRQLHLEGWFKASDRKKPTRS